MANESHLSLERIHQTIVENKFDKRSPEDAFWRALIKIDQKYEEVYYWYALYQKEYQNSGRLFEKYYQYKNKLVSYTPPISKL